MTSPSRHALSRPQTDHVVYGRLAELARRRHRKMGRTSIALLANLRASSLGERRPSDHEMSTWDKVDLSSSLRAITPASGEPKGFIVGV